MEVESLSSEMKRELRKWAFSTKVYGTIYVLVRLLLIVGSGIVAAEKGLSDSRVASLIQWVPVLALGISILTALDTWMKPRDKWRGFMEDRDELSNLIFQVAEAEGTEKPASSLRKEFRELRRKHREKNVY